jgi:predicted alpha/beta superfamily hydrolase
MKRSFTTAAMTLCLLLSPFPDEIAYSQAPGPGASTTVTKVEIPETQLRRVTSSVDRQEYDVYVHLPADYSNATKTYPVLYLLDAQWDFPLVVGLVESLTDDGFVPPMMVVGITWGGKAPDYGYLRFRDLTPTNSPRFPQSGNGLNFLHFIRNDLIPRIESDYRAAKTDRTLMGNSLGGLFGLYALFAEPGLFNRYVLSSPNLGFAGGIFPYESRYASTASALPVRLFIAVGDVEGPHIGQVQDFATLLRSRHYRELELETLIVKSAGHSSNKPEGFVRGLQAVFAPKPLAINEAILDRYVGKYQFRGYTEDIVRDKGELFVVIPEGTRFLLNPTSEKDFYTRGVYMVVHFKSNDAGNIVGMDVEQPDGRVYVEKIS